jgi:hypothetical protein
MRQTQLRTHRSLPAKSTNDSLPRVTAWLCMLTPSIMQLMMRWLRLDSRFMAVLLVWRRARPCKERRQVQVSYIRCEASRRFITIVIKSKNFCEATLKKPLCSQRVVRASSCTYFVRMMCHTTHLLDSCQQLLLAGDAQVSCAHHGDQALGVLLDLKARQLRLVAAAACPGGVAAHVVWQQQVHQGVLQEATCVATR